jgi:ketosteroid isomerase-like protein
MATASADLLRAVRELDEEFVRSANTAAAALTGACYADDAVLPPPGSPKVGGAAAIRAFWQAFIDSGVADVSIETPRVEEAGDLAYGIGTYACTRPSAGGERIRDTGKYLVVHRRQPNGGWKVIADQFNTDLPPS